MTRVICTFLCVAAAATVFTQPSTGPNGVRLERQSWVEAARLLGDDTVVVLPLGAALKEHGPHLKLRNDLTITEYLTDRVVQTASIVAAPPLTYHFYPAFLEYPGSTSLTLDTARDLTIQVARSLARYGPRRFYVLNTGISTTRALEPAAQTLAAEGVLLRYTDFATAAERAAARVKQQPGGSHADEIETSIMLYIDPASVDMTLAVKDFSTPTFAPPLTRQPGGRGTYSPSGIWGDATLATREKGEVIVEGIVQTILQDIESLRTAAPQPVRAPATGRALPSGAMAEPRSDGACPPGVERDIKRVEAAFNAHWKNRDAESLAILWSREGDLFHGDGTIERGRSTIEMNRRHQFKAPEYRSARHAVRFDIVRCLTDAIAIVDGRWDLQDVTDAAGKPLPRVEGLLTLVMRRADDQWLIEAYRYNTKPAAPVTPTLQKKPGYPDKG